MTPPMPADRQPPDIRVTLSADLEALKRDRDVISAKGLRLKAMLDETRATEAFIDGRIAQTSRILDLLPALTMTPACAPNSL